MSARTVRIVVSSANHWDDEKGMPENAMELVAFLQALLDKVPEAYRNDAIMSLDTEYDSGSIDFEFYYERPETEAETHAREDLDRRRGEARVAHQQQEELALLMRLQAKYRGFTEPK